MYLNWHFTTILLTPAGSGIRIFFFYVTVLYCRHHVWSPPPSVSLCVAVLTLLGMYTVQYLGKSNLVRTGDKRQCFLSYCTVYSVHCTYTLQYCITYPRWQNWEVKVRMKLFSCGCPLLRQTSAKTIKNIFQNVCTSMKTHMFGSSLNSKRLVCP